MNGRLEQTSFFRDYFRAYQNAIATPQRHIDIEKSSCPAPKEPIVKVKRKIDAIQDNCTVLAVIKQTKKQTRLIINLAKYPKQTVAIGKHVGDEIDMGIRGVTYVVTDIYVEE